MKARPIFALVLALFMLSPGPGRGRVAGAIETSHRYPTQGNPTFILVRTYSGEPLEGAVVSITYRPGSRVEKRVPVGKTNAAGIVEWKPQVAGIAGIEARWMAEEEREIVVTKNVSVRFSSTPPGGIFIMALAGILLIGGSIRRFVLILRSPKDNGAKSG